MISGVRISNWPQKCFRQISSSEKNSNGWQELQKLFKLSKYLPWVHRIAHNAHSWRCGRSCGWSAASLPYRPWWVPSGVQNRQPPCTANKRSLIGCFAWLGAPSRLACPVSLIGTCHLGLRVQMQSCMNGSQWIHRRSEGRHRLDLGWQHQEQLLMSPLSSGSRLGTLGARGRLPLLARGDPELGLLLLGWSCFLLACLDYFNFQLFDFRAN